MHDYYCKPSEHNIMHALYRQMVADSQTTCAYLCIMCQRLGNGQFNLINPQYFQSSARKEGEPGMRNHVSDVSARQVNMQQFNGLHIQVLLMVSSCSIYQRSILQPYCTCQELIFKAELRLVVSQTTLIHRQIACRANTTYFMTWMSPYIVFFLLFQQAKFM